ncbi:hypothetical protein BGZ47_010355 [Haplosporangium gracile]|nr:hypothetical protein BGZ47_010355 [Haplosporangium gracile]
MLCLKIQSESNDRTWANEMEILSGVNHPNVIGFKPYNALSRHHQGILEILDHLSHDSTAMASSRKNKKRRRSCHGHD